MPDLRAPLRLVDEVLWCLRREGLSISTAQAIDAARAVRVVGFASRDAFREALAAVVVQRRSERGRFDAAMDAFFDATAGRAREGGDLWERLARNGVTGAEIDGVRALLGELAAGGVDGLTPLGLLLDRGAELDRVLYLAGFSRSIDAQSGPQLGFLTHRLLAQVGTGRAHAALGALRARLLDAFGDRGRELAEILARELERAEDDVRLHVRRALDARVSEEDRRRDEHLAVATPFTALNDAEFEAVRQAVRRLAERLRGAARVRARHARRGRIDPHRTLRRALSTGGVPFLPMRRTRRRDRPRLLLLCDISDSVRAAAVFLLEFTYAVHELLDRARSFVFVSDLGETTQLFEREPVRAAIGKAWGGAVVPTGDNSNYGRVLRRFEREHLDAVDRRTTVVILGDGRTNYHDAAAPVLDRIRGRARALLWLCPEPRGQWAQGDSAMPLYAPRCTAVYEVRCAEDLEQVARLLVSRR